MRTAMLLGALLLPVTASAQSTIYGLDVRQGNFFTSDTADFLGNYSIIGANADPVFAIDFDSTGTTLWGVKNDTLEYGTFDLTTGLFTALGTTNVTTGLGATGLTAAIDGQTWYLSVYDSALGRTFLYSGDVTTGNFSQVGLIIGAIVIDIAIDSANNMYAHNISADTLMSVDITTGLGTTIGATGLAANFAQGMDFDWSNDTLYAAIYTGGGTGAFCQMDLTTGAANILADTLGLNGEFEIAVVGAAPNVGAPYCFGDGTGTTCPCGNTGGAGEGCANSTGSGAVLEAAGSNSASLDSLTFSATGLLPAQPALLFVGENALNGGNGIAFGDGLRCAGLNVIRLGVMTPNGAGAASWGPGLGATGGWANGDTRRFQAWYRDPSGSPCGTGFNLSNGFEVTFTP